jgi:A/G-specific adenine glycosylase
LPQPFEGFADLVVAWQKQHGRNDLPWQNTRDPYKVWLSEIMLQQTQVATVKGYFARFLARFPDVASLANGTQDEVMGLWSGLGYYSRARNLHLCAQQIVALHAGVFPKDAQTLASLPGIGRSTASAISSLCFGERVAILDANVKRVVARVRGFDKDLGAAVHEKTMWQLATELIPGQGASRRTMARYTQGMMDIGAGVCSPKKPHCLLCPVSSMCVARESGDPQRYPVRSRKLKRSSQSIWVLEARCGNGDVWLSKRPAPGVWAGLYCLPLFDSEEALHAAVPPPLQNALLRQEPFMHVLTHKDLHLHPWLLELDDPQAHWVQGRWVAGSEWPGLGLPAPVRKLLERD